MMMTMIFIVRSLENVPVSAAPGDSANYRWIVGRRETATQPSRRSCIENMALSLTGKRLRCNFFSKVE
jgi:hypothetical protein